MNDAFLLWSELLLVWSVSQYFPPEPAEPAMRAWIVRAALAGLAVFFLSHSWFMSLAMLVVTLGQAQIRRRPNPRGFEAEHAFIAVLIAGSLIALRYAGSVPFVTFTVPLPAAHIAALCLSIVILLFAVRGGARVVRGILNYAEVPSGATAQRRGYFIGMLERLVLTFVVALGSFSALGFLIAAKGLIRSSRFTGDGGQDFTEYFLIGTLTSTLLALLSGLAIRLTLHTLWPELIALEMK